MQKILALLLTIAALVSLSACGSKTDKNARQYTPSVYDSMGGGNGTGANGSPNPENNPAGRTLKPSELPREGNREAGDSIGDDMVTPYEDMVENGRIRDTDGILSDGENPQN